MVFQVVAGAEGLVARTGDDGYPELGIGMEFVEGCDKFLIRHGVAGVVNFRSIDGDNHQPTIDLYLAILAHGVPSVGE
jgi:hypothetical protein